MRFRSVHAYVHACMHVDVEQIYIYIYSSPYNIDYFQPGKLRLATPLPTTAEVLFSTGIFQCVLANLCSLSLSIYLSVTQQHALHGYYLNILEWVE